jgi:hypothetical protein
MLAYTRCVSTVTEGMALWMLEASSLSTARDDTSVSFKMQPADFADGRSDNATCIHQYYLHGSLRICKFAF